jgi:hypothetical protein
LNAGNLGPVQETSSYHVKDLAWGGAKYSHEVLCLFAGKGGCGGGPGISNPATAGHS